LHLTLPLKAVNRKHTRATQKLTMQITIIGVKP